MSGILVVDLFKQMDDDWHAFISSIEDSLPMGKAIPKEYQDLLEVAYRAGFVDGADRVGSAAQ